MPAPLSVVIPTLDAAATLPGSAATLFEGLEAGLIRELIVADGGSNDDTRKIADALGARVIRAPRGRGQQLAAGAAAARGAWLLFLHADTRLPAGWTGAVQRHMQDHPDQAASFRLSFDVKGPMPRIVAAWANLRSRLFALPYGDQGLLIPGALYRRVGGHPEIPLMEDVALARALSGRIRLMPLAVTTDAARYRRRGWLRQGARNLWRQARFLAGTDPARLAKGYDDPPPSN